MSRYLIAATVLSVLSATACDAPTFPDAVPTVVYSNAPADGNGNKLVFTFDFTDPVDCGSEIITRRIQGWFQVRVLGGAGNPNVQIAIFKSTATFTNEAGETYIFRGVDAERYWYEGGQLYVAVHGRLPIAELGSFFIGTLILNLDTGEVVFQRGPVDSLPRVHACEALT
ncbi:hypothetical protein BH23GEM9_BH23GEM9_10740 [soil metagenome]